MEKPKWRVAMDLGDSPGAAATTPKLPARKTPDDALPGSLVSSSYYDFMYSVIFSTCILTECVISSNLSAISGIPQQYILPVVLFPLLLVLNAVAQAMGNAQLNPVSILVTKLTGALPSTDWTVIFARMGAQVAGVAVGVWLLAQWAPAPFTACVGVFKPQVAPGLGTWGGALVECAITFILHYVGLLTSKLPKGSAFWGIVAHYGPTVVAVMLVALAGPHTGSFMNPAMALAWGYHKGVHEGTGYWVVYHIAPMAGGLLAVLLFRGGQAAPKKLQKKQD